MLQPDCGALFTTTKKLCSSFVRGTGTVLTDEDEVYTVDFYLMSPG